MKNIKKDKNMVKGKMKIINIILLLSLGALFLSGCSSTGIGISNINTTNNIYTGGNLTYNDSTSILGILGGNEINLSNLTSGSTDDQILFWNDNTKILSIETGNSVNLSNLSGGVGNASLVVYTADTTNWDKNNSDDIPSSSAECSGTDQVYNVTINSSGIFVLCSAQGSGGGGMSSFNVGANDGDGTTSITDGETIYFNYSNNILIDRVGNDFIFSNNLTNLSQLTNDAGFITGYTETDPLWSSNASLVVYTADTSNWDKNASDDFDGLYTSLDFTGTTGLSDNIDNDTTYSNLSEFTNDVGYITGYTETDPSWTSNYTNGYNKTAWDLAYSWGNHATQNYNDLDTNPNTDLDSTDDLTTSDEANLNVNSSNYWDSLDSYNVTQFFPSANDLLNLNVTWVDTLFIGQNEYVNLDTDSTDDLITSTNFGGDVSGTYNDIQISTDVIGENEINFTQVTLSDFIDDLNHIEDNTSWNKSYADTLYQPIGSYLTSVTSADIIDSQIMEVDLNATNSPTDNYVLTFDSASGGFTWEQDQTGGTASSCPAGFSCPTTYAELLTDSTNDSVTHIWLEANGTYTENGNDWFITNDKVILGNDAKIVYDTVGCSGGNVHPYTNKFITIDSIWFEGNDCSTAMIHNTTSGAGHLTFTNNKITDIPQKSFYYYGKSAIISRNNFSQVQAGMTLDNTLYSGNYEVTYNTLTWDNATSTTESEAIDLNHLDGYGYVAFNVIGTEDGLNSFQENAIDCNIAKCTAEKNIIYNDPLNTVTQTILFLDTTTSVDKDFKAIDNIIYNVCQNMTGIKIGGSSSTTNDLGLMRGNRVYGCGDGVDADNAGIEVASNIKKSLLIENYVVDTYYAALTSAANVTLAWNDLSGTNKDWHDSAAAATRATNVRMDRDIFQTGTSGYLYLDNPVREWEITNGGTPGGDGTGGWTNTTTTTSTTLNVETSGYFNATTSGDLVYSGSTVALGQNSTHICLGAC